MGSKLRGSRYLPDVGELLMCGNRKAEERRGEGGSNKRERREEVGGYVWP